MTGDRSLFVDFNKKMNSDQEITIGNKMKLPVLGTGTVNVTNGTLKNILLVKGLGVNLISVYKIVHARYEFVVNANQVIVRDKKKNPSNIIAISRVDHEESLLKFVGFVDDKYTLSHAFIAQTDDMSELWHARLGHINYIKLQDMVRGLTNISACKGVCEECVLGKHHREPFDSGKAWKANHPLQLIHSDLCEPGYTSLSNARYLLTFIDYYSRRVWVYFLERKNEVFEFF